MTKYSCTHIAPTIIMSRQCSKCHVTLPASAGVNRYCAGCRRTYQSEYRKRKASALQPDAHEHAQPMHEDDQPKKPAHRQLKTAMAKQFACITQHYARWLQPECLSITFAPPLVLRIMGCSDWAGVQKKLEETPGSDCMPDLVHSLATLKLRLCSCRQYNYKIGSKLFGVDKWLRVLQLLFSEQADWLLISHRAYAMLPILSSVMLDPRPAVYNPSPQQLAAYADDFERVVSRKEYLLQYHGFSNSL